MTGRLWGRNPPGQPTRRISPNSPLTSKETGHTLQGMVVSTELQAIRERFDELANRNVAEMGPRELEDAFEQMVRDANTLIATILGTEALTVKYAAWSDRLCACGKTFGYFTHQPAECCGIFYGCVTVPNHSRSDHHDPSERK